MKTRIFIIALFSVIAINIGAQKVYAPACEVSDEVMWNTQQRMASGSQYTGTVYEPFGSTVPSEQSEVGQTTKTRESGHGPNKFIGGPESGQGPSPVGDAVLPLLAMALLFGAIVYRRRQRCEGN